MKTKLQLIVEKLARDLGARPADVSEGDFLKSLRLPEDGSKDFEIFDPAHVRIKRGRIFLPGIGWVKSDVMKPLPPDERLVEVTVRMDGGDWVAEIKTAKRGDGR